MNKLYKEEDIQAIGNAIRTKGGTSALLKVEDMAQAIADIPEPTGTETVTENGTYNIASKKYVAVNVPQTGIEPQGTLTITNNGTYNIRNYEYVLIQVGAPPIEPQYRDIVPIPDRYNTGLTNPNAEFTVVTSTSTTMGAVNLRKQGEQFYIDWNNGGNKSLTGEVVIENYDFQTNKLGLGIMNGWGYTNPEGVTIIFRNCKFDNITVGVTTNDLINTHIENCIISNGVYCSHGWVKNSNVTVYNGGDALGGEHVLYQNVYAYDIDKPSDVAGTGHQDGAQFFTGDYYELDNVRIEFPAINYTYHTAQWSTNLFVQTDTVNASVKDCVFSGKHPNSYLVHAVNPNISVNNTLFQSNSFYPNGLTLNDCIDSKVIDTIYVGSVVKSNGNITVYATNDTHTPRVLQVTTNKGDTVFNLSKYFEMNDYAVNTKSFSDYPIDVPCTISADGVEYVVCYDITDSENPVQIRYLTFNT